MPNTTDRYLLRHALATLAYRGGKALQDAPEDFAGYKVGPTSRTPIEILSHLGDLMAWAVSMAEDDQKWSDTNAEDWGGQLDRFFAELQRFDDFLATDRDLGFPATNLLQGPVADALTHVGQIAMLRRLAGSPVKGENYSKADIQVGSVGADQPSPGREFD